jgi:sugar phosphate isomerase/epimerase
MKIGAQLYTVHDFTTTLDGFAESLKKVADIGYTTVQVSGTCEYDPQWLKEQLDANGLKCVITHIHPKKITEDALKVCRDHDVFGCRCIGIGGMPYEINEENYAKLVNEYKPAARVIADNGHKFFFHNHHGEFARMADGRLVMEHLMEDFTNDEMGFTFDTYWAQFGGADPAAWLEKLAGRVECIHLKDLCIVNKEQRMAPVGYGNLNFERIIDVAGKSGVEYMLVEQDRCYDEDPFDCLKRSYDYLKACGF